MVVLNHLQIHPIADAACLELTPSISRTNTYPTYLCSRTNAHHKMGLDARILYNRIVNELCRCLDSPRINLHRYPISVARDSRGVLFTSLVILDRLALSRQGFRPGLLMYGKFGSRGRLRSIIVRRLRLHADKPLLFSRQMQSSIT
jgi:hypothetical protein